MDGQRKLLSDCFVFGVAEALEVAVDAAGFACDTHAAAVPDQLVGEENPSILRNHLHQIQFDFFRVGIAR